MIVVDFDNTYNQHVVESEMGEKDLLFLETMQSPLLRQKRQNPFAAAEDSSSFPIKKSLPTISLSNMLWISVFCIQ